MNIVDIVTMLGNLVQSLSPVQQLLSGAAYMLGIIFIIVSIRKMKKIADARAQSHSQEKMFVPFAFLVTGSLLLFLPSSLKVFSGTLFGPDNMLSYASPNRFDIYYTMSVLIKTIGIVWFIRGCVLMAYSSQPGVEHGAKGLLFVLAGIIAFNLENTTAVVNNILDYITAATLAFNKNQGY